MTFSTPTAFAHVVPSLWDRTANLRDALGARAAQRQLYRTTLAELEALSDRDLSDVELARADVGRVAREAVRS